MTKRKRTTPQARHTRSAGAKQPLKRFSSKQNPSSSQQMLTVVAETDHYVVVDKPALLDSQNSKEGRDSVVDWLQKRFNFAGLVHRLDFGTSGLMVCAKTAEAAKKLTQAMQNGEIERTYWAVVLGRVASSKNSEIGTIDEMLDGQTAVTHYRVREYFPNATLVEINLETGRKHQIRKHFANAGHPLLGDHLYGKGGAKLLFHRPALHALRLSVMGEIFETELPSDLAELLTRLKSRRS